VHRDNRARVARPPPHAIGLPGGFRPVATSPSVAPRLRNPCCASGVCDFRRAAVAEKGVPRVWVIPIIGGFFASKARFEPIV